MKATNQRILFMGTPDFAVATLNAMIEAGLDVRAVVTAPDRPAGRGRQLRSSAVKLRALELGLPVLQPEKLKDSEFLAELERIDATLYVVVAFRMLPEVVWAKPALGTVNLHGSLLPAYRGAAPINWAVINGEAQTGVTTFRIQHQIDTGDVLLRHETPIGANETAGDVHDRLMLIGAHLMVRTVQGLLAGTIVAKPQVMSSAAPPPTAPKLTTANMQLHFNRSAREVHDHVRGLSPYPGAWCTWTDTTGQVQHLKVLRTATTDRPAEGEVGTLRATDQHLFVRCKDQLLEILELQVEGRKRMMAAEFLRGTRQIEGGELS